MPDWLVDLSQQPFREEKAPDKQKWEYPPLSKSENERALAKALDSCAFLKHCRVDAKVLPEPEWQGMVELLVFFGEPGIAKIHELSNPYPMYSEGETNKKIANAIKAIGKKQLGPYTCEKIERSLGFKCPSDCLAIQLGTKTPVTTAIKAITAREEPPLDNTYLESCIYLLERYTPATEAKRYKNVTESVTESVTNTQKGEDKALQAQEKLSQQVLSWVKGTTGWWGVDELDKDLGLTGAQGKNYRRLILFRLKEQGIIEPHQKINKQWRYVNTRVTSLNFKTASTTGVLPIQWPMGIEKYVNLFPGNLVVIAGSPNAGKTAFNLNFIYLNQDKFPITYICSEMGEVELRNRLEQFPGMAIADWNFKAEERASDFADVVVPDTITIIDYLEMTTELYEINTHLTKIAHRIGSGLALVAIQKKFGAAFGRGQEFSLEKPKLYLSLDRGIMKIVKAKSWAKKNVDPCGLEVSFKITGGCQFTVTEDWDWKHGL
jgi:hypothetical protein